MLIDRGAIDIIKLRGLLQDLPDPKVPKPEAKTGGGIQTLGNLERLEGCQSAAAGIRAASYQTACPVMRPDLFVSRHQWWSLHLACATMRRSNDPALLLAQGLFDHGLN